MAGPYTGTWFAKAVTPTQYSGIEKQGTGVNPIHSATRMGPYIGGRAKLTFDPVVTPGGDTTQNMTPDYTAEDLAWNPDPTQPEYNTTEPELFGYDEETGTADRPTLGNEQGDAFSSEMGWGLPNPDPGPPLAPSARAKTQNSTRNGYPSWGGSRKTSPAGTIIRAFRKGSIAALSAKALPLEDVAQGWTNKNKGIAADSEPSDPSQLVMQTSQTQRYKVRAGSQRQGSQSTFDAPVESRVTGQKLKTYSRSDSARHWDMLPYEQNDYIRPFLSRTVGTGYREWMYPNEMYVSPALQREPAPDPALGPVETSSVNGGSGYAYDFTEGYY